jgi:hypothetical protein
MNSTEPLSKTLYIKAVLDLYVSLPDTPPSPRRDDRYLAQQFHRKALPLYQVEAALLLGTARRAFRNDPDPLEPIRSLRYFIPLVEEVRRSRVEESYAHYLRDKLGHLLKPTRIRGPTACRARQLNLPW